jgi:hypothetical protein
MKLYIKGIEKCFQCRFYSKIYGNGFICYENKKMYKIYKTEDLPMPKDCNLPNKNKSYDK